MTIRERLNKRLRSLELGHIEYINIYGQGYTFTDIKKSDEEKYTFKYEEEGATLYHTCNGIEELVGALTSNGQKIAIESVMNSNGKYHVVRG